MAQPKANPERASNIRAKGLLTERRRANRNLSKARKPQYQAIRPQDTNKTLWNMLLALKYQ